MKMRELTSRKCILEQVIIMPNLWQSLQFFYSHTSVFALEKFPKNLNFLSFFNETLVTIFNEKRAPTFKKYVAKQDIITSYLLQSL